MFENITPEMWILISAIGGAILVGYVCYVSAYIEHKKEKALAEQMSRANGETYPTYEVEKVARWFHGYTLALVVEVVLSAFLGCLAVMVVSAEFVLSGITKPVVAFVASVVYGLIVDRFIVHPIADGQFYERVEKPLIEEFLCPGQDIDEVETTLNVRESVKGAVAELLAELLEKK